MEDDTTPCSLAGSVSFGILLNVSSGGDHIVGLNAEHVEEKVVDLIAVRRTKKNPQKWIVMKHDFKLVS